MWRFNTTMLALMTNISVSLLWKEKFILEVNSCVNWNSSMTVSHDRVNDTLLKTMFMLLSGFIFSLLAWTGEPHSRTSHISNRQDQIDGHDWKCEKLRSRSKTATVKIQSKKHSYIKCIGKTRTYVEKWSEICFSFNVFSAQSFKKLKFSLPKIQTVPFKNSFSFSWVQHQLRFSHSGPSDASRLEKKSTRHTQHPARSPCFSAWYSTMKSFILWSSTE